MRETADGDRAAKVYWAALVLAGGVATAWALARCLTFTPSQGLQLLALASFVVLAGALPLRIPGTVAHVTFADGFIFLGVILLGVPGAVVLAAAGAGVASLRATKRRAAWLSAPATSVLAAACAGKVFYVALHFYAVEATHPVGMSRLSFEQLFVPLVLLALAQYFAQGVLGASLRAFAERSTVWRCWHDHYLWTVWTFLAAAIATGLLYEAILTFGVLAVLLSVPVVGATFATYKIYFERVMEPAHETFDLARLHLSTVEALATAIDAKDQTTHCHVRRVQIYAAGMGRVLGLPPSEIEALRAGAMLHDIGKLAVPDHILNKPGKLTSAEFERMKVHTTVGAQILERIDFPYPVVPVVRHHHERWDGLGYPDGLSGELIPWTARVFAVVDCFDSLREERPYRRGMTSDEACALLRRGAGTHFDPRVVGVFLAHLPQFELEIERLGLNQHGFTNREAEPRSLIVTGDDDNHAVSFAREQADAPTRFTPPAYLDQIKLAHREVYELYEIARAFGSSLDLGDCAEFLVEKIGHVVPFDTGVVYFYDGLKNYATVGHATGLHAGLLRARCVAPGEGVIGFVLANRRPVSGFDPMLDFANLPLPETECYRSMIALPLVKDERLLGVLAVYARAAELYTADHVRLLDTVARLAADAFANALRHAETQSNALTDALTELPNARALHLRFDEEVARAQRGDTRFQVLMLDLDEFKQVNDTFGHQTGDQMLREASRVLQAQLREYDFLARYAGDEFVAIVHDLNAAQVDDLRARIEQSIARLSLRVGHDKHARIGVSVGAASYGTHGETLSQLLVAADQSMYAVKSDHRQLRAPADPLNTGNLASSAIN